MPVIVVELCWQGGLVPKRTDLSIEELADDVLHVVNKLNPGNFFISGHSIGGMITVEIEGRNVHGLRGAIPMEGWRASHLESLQPLVLTLCACGTWLDTW